MALKLQEFLEDLDLMFYALTDGCYVLSDEMNNFVVGYRCDASAPNVIDMDGQDLYIKYLQGDMKILISFASGIRNIVFDRLETPGKYKIVNFDKIKSKLQ